MRASCACAICLGYCVSVWPTLSKPSSRPLRDGDADLENKLEEIKSLARPPKPKSRLEGGDYGSPNSQEFSSLLRRIGPLCARVAPRSRIAGAQARRQQQHGLPVRLSGSAYAVRTGRGTGDGEYTRASAYSARSVVAGSIRTVRTTAGIAASNATARIVSEGSASILGSVGV